MSSGLDQLTAQRERSSRRSMPPPRHPPRSTPVALPAEPDQATVVPVTNTQTGVAQDAPATPVVQAAIVGAAVAPESFASRTRPAPIPTKAGPQPAKTAPVKPTPPAESSGSEDELAKYSIYFDGIADEFLEATRVAGRRLRPKLSISRSSVVRLALERLSDSMSPDEVAAELSRNAATARSGTGRPRL